MDVVLEKLAEHGIMGLIAALFIYLYIKQVKATQDESQARINDSKEGLKLALDIQRGTTDTVGKLQAIFEEMIRRTR